MIITTFTCDRCGHSQDKEYGMWNVGICVVNYPQQFHPYCIRSAQLWCRACCDKFQIIVDPPKKEGQPAPVEFTLEEKIREIMREEILNHMGKP